MRNAFSDLLQVVHDYLNDPETRWPIAGRTVAPTPSGESPEIRLDYTGGQVLTSRGAMRIVLPTNTRLAPCEALSDDGLWVQASLLCLPAEEAAMAQRRGLSELGYDLLAARPEDRLGTLFDLGTGPLEAELCVRSADPALLAFLRKHIGHDAASSPEIMAAVESAQADHVVQSRLGRIESYGAALAPVDHMERFIPPEGFLSGLAFISPQRMADGAMDRATFETFRILQNSFAEPALWRFRNAVTEGIRNGAPPGSLTDADPPHPDTLRLTLRQIEYTDGPSETLAAWRTAFDSA